MTTQNLPKICNCGKEWGTHESVYSEYNIKDICVYCLDTLKNSITRYKLYGNMCRKCSADVTSVIQKIITSEECSVRILSRRNKNK